MPCHTKPISSAKLPFPETAELEIIKKGISSLPPPLLIIRRHLIINIPHQAHPHLRRIVPPQHIADEVRLDLHLHHLERAPQHAAEDVGEPELVLRAPVVGQLDEVRERVLLEDEGELLPVRRPVGDGGGDVEEDFEADLRSLVMDFKGWGEVRVEG